MTLHSQATPLSNALAIPSARLWALVPSAGVGSRAGLSIPKQYHRLAGQRVIDHTVAVLAAMPQVEQVCVLVSPDDTQYHSPSNRVQVHGCGGATRAHTVVNGLIMLKQTGAQPNDWVLVHDAARCLVMARDIEPLLQACASDEVGGLLAIAAPDTLKVAYTHTPTPTHIQGQPSSCRSQRTLDRSGIWLAQTPQMFRLAPLLAAMQAHEATDYSGLTDEASAMELAGLQPLLVQGSAHNLKVTYPQDFALAEAILQQRRSSQSVGRFV